MSQPQEKLSESEVMYEVRRNQMLANSFDHKIENGTGWYLDADVQQAKRERYQYRQKIKQLEIDYPEYFL